MVGVIYGAMTGKMADVTNAALDSAGDAVSLCITMIGVMALWVGLMEIAQKSGLIAKLTRGIQPFISFLFPRIPEGHPAREYISTNLIANILGLGWACTPAGLKAMESLAQLEKERGNPAYLCEGNNMVNSHKNGLSSSAVKGQRNYERIASTEMCTFLILNISSLQIIPVNMIAYRQQYGSVNPAGIIAPAIVATFFSTLTAIVYCKIMNLRQRA